jgi:hypothetical protein
MILSVEHAALARASNRVNAARNQTGSLALYLTAPEHRAEARRAYDLLVQAEGILEALRDRVPAYAGGTGQDA